MGLALQIHTIYGGQHYKHFLEQTIVIRHAQIQR
jgi:hypothetical protein